jgi:hypothetical protein
VLDLSATAGVEKLALFHHEPTHTDRDMDRIDKEARSAAKKRMKSLEVVTAREGMTLDV